MLSKKPGIHFNCHKCVMILVKILAFYKWFIHLVTFAHVHCTGGTGVRGSSGVKGVKGPDGATGAIGATGARDKVIRRRVARQAGCPGMHQSTHTFIVGLSRHTTDL